MVDILKAMLAHYSSPDRWIQGSFFNYEVNGGFYWTLKDKEYSCCLVGGLLVNCEDIPTRFDVMNILNKITEKKYNIGAVQFNDNPNTKFEDVIEVLKEAIVIAEKENVP